MAEMRVDKLKDENAALKAALGFILDNNAEVKGRAVAEHLLGRVSTTVQTVSICPKCGAKYFGASCFRGCNAGADYAMINRGRVG